MSLFFVSASRRPIFVLLLLILTPLVPASGPSKSKLSIEGSEELELVGREENVIYEEI